VAKPLSKRLVADLSPRKPEFEGLIHVQFVLKQNGAGPSFSQSTSALPFSVNSTNVPYSYIIRLPSTLMILQTGSVIKKTHLKIYFTKKVTHNFTQPLNWANQFRLVISHHQAFFLKNSQKNTSNAIGLRSHSFTKFFIKH
jgi:hypothetical protein